MDEYGYLKRVLPVSLLNKEVWLTLERVEQAVMGIRGGSGIVRGVDWAVLTGVVVVFLVSMGMGMVGGGAWGGCAVEMLMIWGMWYVMRSGDGGVVWALGFLVYGLCGVAVGYWCLRWGFVEGVVWMCVWYVVIGCGVLYYVVEGDRRSELLKYLMLARREDCIAVVDMSRGCEWLEEYLRGIADEPGRALTVYEVRLIRDLYKAWEMKAQEETERRNRRRVVVQGLQIGSFGSIKG